MPCDKTFNFQQMKGSFELYVSAGTGPLPGGPVTTGPILLNNGDTLHFWSVGSVEINVLPGSVDLKLSANNIFAEVGLPVGLPPDPNIEALWVDTDTKEIYYWNPANQAWEKAISGGGTIDPRIICSAIETPPPLIHWYGADALQIAPREGTLQAVYKTNLQPKTYAINGEGGDDAEWSPRLNIHDPAIDYGPVFAVKPEKSYNTNANAKDGVFTFIHQEHLIWWDLDSGEPLGYARIGGGFLGKSLGNFIRVVYDDVQEVLWVWLGRAEQRLMAVSVAEREQWGTDPLNPYVISPSGLPAIGTCSAEGRICVHGPVSWSFIDSTPGLEPVVYDPVPSGYVVLSQGRRSYLPRSNGMGLVRDHDNDEMFAVAHSQYIGGAFEFYPLTVGAWDDPSVTPTLTTVWAIGDSLPDYPGNSDAGYIMDYYAPIIVGGQFYAENDYAGSKCTPDVFTCGDFFQKCRYTFVGWERQFYQVGITNGNVWITWHEPTPFFQDDCSDPRDENVTGLLDCRLQCLPQQRFPLIAAEWKKERNPNTRSRWTDLSTTGDPDIRFPNKLPNEAEPPINLRRGAYWMDLYRPGQYVTEVICDLTNNVDFSQLSPQQIQDLRNILDL